MNDADSKFRDKREGYQFKRELAWVVVVCAPVVLGTAWAVGTRINDSYSDLSSIVDAHSSRLNVFDEYRTNHAGLEAAQQLRITELDRESRDLERQIILFQAKLDNARPDPNTGTEGRARDARLDKIEKQLQTMQNQLRN